MRKKRVQRKRNVQATTRLSFKKEVLLSLLFLSQTLSLSLLSLTSCVDSLSNSLPLTCLSCDLITPPHNVLMFILWCKKKLFSPFSFLVSLLPHLSGLWSYDYVKWIPISCSVACLRRCGSHYHPLLLHFHEAFNGVSTFRMGGPVHKGEGDERERRRWIGTIHVCACITMWRGPHRQRKRLPTLTIYTVKNRQFNHYLWVKFELCCGAFGTPHILWRPKKASAYESMTPSLVSKNECDVVVTDNKTIYPW